MAVLDIKDLESWQPVPRRLAILSQTTQIPEKYTQFVKSVIGLALHSGSEIRIYDTICPSVGERQSAAVRLAQEVDLMLVVGSQTSANTKRLYDLCSPCVETHLIGSAADIDPVWLKGKSTIGVTSGTSASQESINEVVECLESLNWPGIQAN